MKILSKGAEATIFLSKEKIVKDRIPKSYRLPALDQKLIKQRTKSEGKLLDKASKIVPTPKLLASPKQGRMIHMQHIPGKRLSTNLEKLNYKQICKTLALQVSKLHKNNIIHGDLTTSNLILHNKKLYIIDYGLGFISSKKEDKATDLKVLKEALLAKHHSIYKQCWETFIKNYSLTEVKKQLQKVEKRGRYKQQY